MRTQISLALAFILLTGLLLGACSAQAGLDLGLEGEGGLGGGLLGGDETESPPEDEGGEAVSAVNLLPFLIIAILFLMLLVVGLAMGKRSGL